MKRLFIFLLLLVVMLGIQNCKSLRSNNYEDTYIKKSILHNGKERTYLLHLPPQDKMNNALPLVFNLHGGGGTAEGNIKLTNGRLNQLSDEEGFILVYPQGLRKSWNDGRAGDFSYAAKNNIDDVGFFKLLIEQLKAAYPIDPDRIYTCGMSNGGFMSMRLACELSGTIRAAGVLTATLSETLAQTCAPDQPVSILLMNGTADPLVPYDGGVVKVLGSERGKILSTDQTIDFWVEQNQCKTTASKERLSDVAPDDGTRIDVFTFSNCRNNSDVVLYKIHGGGHTWPGGLQYLGEKLIGKTSRDIDASDVLWNYFKSLQ